MGIVTSRQGDTVTVLVTEEEITGVIPLTSLPPVGTIVELEARCDITVILDWAQGEPAQPALGDWYFTPAESPGWTEGDTIDAPQGVGLEVANDAPSGPGFLWNRADFKVTPGDVLSFSMLVSQLEGSDVASVQLVFCWDAHGTDPQPATGEVVAYGPVVPVAGDTLEFAASAVVPDTFTGGTPGQARLGLRFEASTDVWIDVPLTRGQWVHGTVIDTVWDMASGPVTLKVDADGLTELRPLQYQGADIPWPGYYPTTPPGYTLSAMRPYVKAHLTAPQAPMPAGGPVWGTPNPERYPYLITTGASINALTLDDLPVGTDPVDVILFEAQHDTPTSDAYYTFLAIGNGGQDTSTQIVVSEFGWRHYYTPVGG